MKRFVFPAFVLAALIAGGCTGTQSAVSPDEAQNLEVTPAPRAWQPVTISFSGPATSEDAETNPFRDYRLDVTFRHDDTGRTFAVPGYFAADGAAAETGATSGDVWRVHFLPDAAGSWSYEVSFLMGDDVAVTDASSGTPVSIDGHSGSIEVAPQDTDAPGFYSRGPLRYVEKRYLQFEDGQYFLKGGADSPENFLAYHEFDGTYSVKQPGQFQSGEAHTAPLHQYEPHVADWKPGDPLWSEDRGKGIIGALNYLASEEMNSVYFLTMNVEGDGSDVWPWTAPDARDRYDVSKLDQWNIVFDHMDRLGLSQHVVLTETENESLFERYAPGETDFADTRKLYYRELIARFGYHPALMWNIGEENGWEDTHRPTTGPSGRANTDAQRKAFADFLHALDPYDHPVVVHTLPGRYDEIYTPLLGFENLEGVSLQMGDMTQTHAETAKWIARSREAGKPWVANLDEIGPAGIGVKPDAFSDHREVRHQALWGNLMAGGGGAEWYFGYRYPHNDLGAEDWRSRDRMWDYTRHALHFFQRYLPFEEMQPADELTPNPNDFVLAKPGEIYALYLPYGVSTTVNLPDGRYDVSWFDPRNGGELLQGDATIIDGGGDVSYGLAPNQRNKDWVVLIGCTAGYRPPAVEADLVLISSQSTGP